MTKQYFYMCRTSFEEDLLLSSDGTKLYPSIKSLKTYSPCWLECGIVKISINLEEVVEQGKDKDISMHCQRH